MQGQSIIISAVTSLIVSVITLSVNQLWPGIIRMLYIPFDTKSIRKLILSKGRTFNLYFRVGVLPKTIQFLPDGKIKNITGRDGETNETTWKICRGKLEVYNAKEELFNRFYYCHDSKLLKSTNDPDIQTKYDQRIAPQAKFYPQFKGAL